MCVNETVFSTIPAVTSLTRTLVTNIYNEISLSGSNVHIQIPAGALAHLGPNVGLQVSSAAPTGIFFILTYTLLYFLCLTFKKGLQFL